MAGIGRRPARDRRAGGYDPAGARDSPLVAPIPIPAEPIPPEPIASRSPTIAGSSTDRAAPTSERRRRPACPPRSPSPRSSRCSCSWPPGSRSRHQDSNLRQAHQRWPRIAYLESHADSLSHPLPTPLSLAATVERFGQVVDTGIQDGQIDEGAAEDLIDLAGRFEEENPSVGDVNGRPATSSARSTSWRQRARSARPSSPQPCGSWSMRWQLRPFASVDPRESAVHHRVTAPRALELSRSCNSAEGPVVR